MKLPPSKYNIGDSVKLTNGTIAIVCAIRVQVSKDATQESYFFQCGDAIIRFEPGDVQCKVKINDQV